MVMIGEYKGEYVQGGWRAISNTSPTSDGHTNINTVWDDNRQDTDVGAMPETGQVIGWIDLSGLLSPADRQQPVDVLNGIAYDAEHDRLFVTGKLWPKLFEIALVPRS